MVLPPHFLGQVSSFLDALQFSSHWLPLLIVGGFFSFFKDFFTSEEELTKRREAEEQQRQAAQRAVREEVERQAAAQREQKRLEERQQAAQREQKRLEEQAAAQRAEKAEQERQALLLQKRVERERLENIKRAAEAEARTAALRLQEQQVKEAAEREVRATKAREAAEKLAQQVAAQQATQQREWEEAERQRLAQIKAKRLADWEKWAETGDYANNLPTIAGCPPRIWNIYEHNSINMEGENMGGMDRGKEILQTEDQLSRYFGGWAGKHIHKLEQCFKNLFDIIEIDTTTEIIIIDYGCGQALATCALISYCASQLNAGLNWSKIILIEPSSAALRRGVLHLKALLPDFLQCEIAGYVCTLDNLSSASLRCKSSATKIHLLSNILDVSDFDIHELAQKIIAGNDGRNIFVCTGPNYGSNDPSAQTRVQEFFDCFDDYYTEPVFDTWRPIFKTLMTQTSPASRKWEWTETKISVVSRVFVVNL